MTHSTTSLERHASPKVAKDNMKANSVWLLLRVSFRGLLHLLHSKGLHSSSLPNMISINLKHALTFYGAEPLNTNQYLLNDNSSIKIWAKLCANIKEISEKQVVAKYLGGLNLQENQIVAFK
ncbi:hypothetical protein ACTXT7_003311 [Hymenolepis weldensis]